MTKTQNKSWLINSHKHKKSGDDSTDLSKISLKLLSAQKEMKKVSIFSNDDSSSHDEHKMDEDDPDALGPLVDQHIFQLTSKLKKKVQRIVNPANILGITLDSIKDTIFRINNGRQFV